MSKVAMSSVVTTALFAIFATSAAAQEPNDLARLQRENELLKKEIELLKKEIALLKKEPKTSQDAKLEDKEPRTKVYESSPGFRTAEYEMIKCVRDPKKPKRVTFTFGVTDDTGHVKLVHCVKGLTLMSRDGKTVDGKVLEVSEYNIRLTKGEVSKFQVTYDGVDESIASFEEVSLRMGGKMGIPRAAMKFYRIKIEPKE